mmetsp:Transcript_36054/g.41040  ORF Transcript_36054/g.41040 Transcript_36054/m.41040 type:complete len:271 (-) Transcript_36054:318-1130(-)
MMREDRQSNVKPANLPTLILGTSILLLGHLFFNSTSSFRADSEVTSDSLRGTAKCTINTLLAGGISSIASFGFKDRLTGVRADGRIKLIATCNGLLAGVVAVSAGCLNYDVLGALVVGFVAALLYSIFCLILNKARIDDTLEVFPIHGICGAWGSIAVGLFHKNDGLFYGAGFSKLGIQLFGTVVIAALACAYGLIYFRLTQELSRRSGLEDIILRPEYQNYLERPSYRQKSTRLRNVTAEEGSDSQRRGTEAFTQRIYPIRAADKRDTR